MKVLVRIEKSGLKIPIEKLKKFREGDIVELEIRKVYADDSIKKALRFPIIQ
ncbi:MAG: hypothetical protein QXH37_00435 [Candidatus Bathyarchaeia archaeon]